MGKIILDTETTGCEKHDRIVELGMVEINGSGEEIQTKQYYFNPQKKVHPGALKVHKLSDNFLKDKPLFSEHADEIALFLQGKTVVIHNAAFDMYYLNYEFALYHQRNSGSFIPLKELCQETVDTLSLARKKFPGQSNSLDALVERFNIDAQSRNERHGALLDARLLAKVYVAMNTSQANLVWTSGASDTKNAARANILSLGPFHVVTPKEEEQREHTKLMLDLPEQCV